jgi:hypothetical protein
MRDVRVDAARWESVKGGNAECCADIEALPDGVLEQICMPVGDSFAPP